jgi:hypothetical protein
MPDIRTWAAVAASLAALAAGRADAAAEIGPRASGPNRPDQRVGLVGDFLWARACDTFEDVAFGETPADLRFTFTAGNAFKRSNLTSLRPQVAYTVQPTHLWLETTGSHNAKLMLGYMSTSWRFTHNDNCDLVHWAAKDRVVLFVPIRHAGGDRAAGQENYFISPYAAQTISVVEFRAGEAIQYAWYRGGPGRLDPHILLDLYPFCGGEKDLKPGVQHPIFKFEVFPGGRWKVSIERDGRDGLAGGETDGDWDLVFTERSPAARPYTVDLSGETAFGVSVYCPSGRPNLGADIRLRLEPFQRSSGRPLAGPAPRTLLRDAPLGRLQDIRLLQPAPYEPPAVPEAADPEPCPPEKPDILPGARAQATGQGGGR